MTMRPGTYRAIGIGFVIAVLGIAWLTKAAFQQQLSPTRDITLVADRAGLMMDPGAGVALRGVNIGRVKAVTPTNRGIRLDLAIQPRYFKLIPADVKAEIIPPTAFGPKYVSLSHPPGPTTPIAEGAVIENQHVTVEANLAFSELMATLDAAQPAQVNSALNALAGTLNGRGEKIGELMSSTNDYLVELNKVAPDIAVDIRRARSVLATYEKATPDLLKVVENTTVTSKTIVDKRGDLETALNDLGESADTSRSFLDANGDLLVETVNLLAPTTKLLAEYSPMLACTIVGMAYFNKQSIPALGGNQPGVATNTRIFPSQVPYKAPENLPKVNAHNPPACHGLPEVKSSQIFDPHIVADTNANPWESATTTTIPGLSNTLFGVLAGLPGL